MRDRLLRALVVLRVLVLVNALGVNAYRFENFRTPLLGALAMGTMVAWSAVAVWAFSAESRRTPPWLVADLAMAVGLILASPLVKDPGMRATVPGFWVMAALLTWAVVWRLPGGLVAASALSVADLAVRQVFTQANYGNIFLIMIGGPIVGYMCEQLYRSAAQRDRAEREAAAAAERARLARAVHDGVLQVLALVQRRGAAATDDDLRELGRMAGEQESALRSLIRRHETPAGPGPTQGSGEVDLADRLGRWESTPTPRTEVATPAGPVLVAAQVVEELDAVVGQCLSNVRHHAGEGARAWVLVEDTGDAVVVSVRDDGTGIPAGRLEEASAQGRLGVSESICGRVRDLGGTATLDTGSWGTEWEFTVPRG